MNDTGRKLYLIKQALIGLLSSPLMKLKLRLFGIAWGKGCEFFGQTYVFRQKGSTIVLGSRLTFRSHASSNLIGINRPCSLSTLAPGARLVIGDDSGLSGTVIGAFVSVELGKRVRCGANTLITDGDWHHDDVRAGSPKAVSIGDDVWLGEGVKVLKGVTIGNNTVIGAGSVVTASIPANVIAAGNPCRVIKTLPGHLK